MRLASQTLSATRRTRLWARSSAWLLASLAASLSLQSLQSLPRNSTMAAW
uniref:Uncharacterized protein n=1 Tax=uncultured marine virus TaxID=186617 RepID=A0A0F7L986_9VIRU|nr:hypothetical protein [uncultured marine virus]